MTRRRIVLTTTELRPGGAERCLVDLALGLSPGKYEPLVYVLAPPPPEPQDGLLNALRRASIPTHFFHARYSVSLPLVVARFRARLRQDQPSLVQSFLYHSHLVSVIANELWRTAARPRIVAGLRVGGESRFRQAVRRILARRTDAYVCVSDDVAHEFETAGGLPGKKLHVIPTGVDGATYADRSHPVFPPSLGIATGRRLLLMLGRAGEQKGSDRLLQGAARLLRDLPQHDLLCVGPGMRSARSQVLPQLNRAGIAERVHACDWFPNVVGLLQVCEILLLPSRWEGFPRVVLEAMAGGLPVVACDVQGVRQALGELGRAQIVPAHDFEAFASRVAELAERSDRIEIGRANAQRVADHFSLARMVAAYERLYDSVLGYPVHDAGSDRHEQLPSCGA